ncbi:hypothetical protein HID58_002961 [Brassica napus]|uniref:Protein kinase domain-containing protein n=1 Tax=Brassica napus TaxID=3708 RepID=A0ABQ8ENQ4_BRANA|nr:hypothetical protein HID58_002961 [Brassica napus]
MEQDINRCIESRKTQLFDTESSADDGAEHENYGDKVDARDIPLLYLETKIQNAPVGSPQRQEAQKNLLEEINHRKQIDQNIIEILRLSLKKTDVLDLLTSTRTTGQPVVDDWDCYKTLVKSFKNQCGAKMEYDMKYAGALANICNMGVDVKKRNHSVDQPGLDWPTRLKIIQGVGKGLGYLFKELPTLTIPHGHLKSSNVVLDKSFEPLLTDYALRPVMNSEQSHNLMIAYKSPEYSLKGHITKKTDVWCLGVLILELITGRFPENYLSKGYDANMSLVTWVSDMVKEKKTSDVFDKEMIGKKNCKAEMLSLLKIGLSCCEEDEERRMEMRDAVEKIERLRESDIDLEASTNVFASRLIEDDDFVPEAAENVYSFGILLLDLLTSKRPTGFAYNVEQAVEQGTFKDMLDDSAVHNWPVEEALTLAKGCA